MLLKWLFGMGNKNEIQSMLNKGAKVIDVRSTEEFRGGADPSSINIPLHIIPLKIEEIKSWNLPIILVCASGGRAEIAKKELEKNSISVINAGNWKNAIA